MARSFAVPLFVVSLVLGAGCQTTGQREVVGSVLGAAGGGLLGSQFGKGTGKLATTALGAVGGLLLGSSIGRSLDDVDRQKQQRATEHALENVPSGVSSAWRNPDSGNQGETIPKRTYQRHDGSYCREFTQTVRIGERSEEAYGTACRQPDGTWKLTD